MASLPEHIKNLLFEQDCVVVPHFGGFITNFHGAVEHEQNGTFLPPRKRIAFNEVLQFDDGLLTSYVALKEQGSRDEARKKIGAFSDVVWRELKRNHRVRLENLGDFTLNSEGKLVFEPEYRINFFAESYGMAPVPVKSRMERPATFRVLAPANTSVKHIPEPTLDVAPEEIAESESLVIPFQPQPRRWLTWPNVAASVGLLLLSLVGWLWVDNSKSALSSLNPLSLMNVREWLPEKLPEQPLAVEKKVTLPQPQKTKITAIAPKSDLVAVVQPISPVGVGVEKKALPAVRKHDVAVVKMAIRAGDEKIRAASDRYYVIVGGFGKLANAKKMMSQLRAKGFSQATLLYSMKSTGLIKVGVGEFTTTTQAIDQAALLREALASSVWILKTR